MQCALPLAVVTVKRQARNLQWSKVIADVVILVVCLGIVVVVIEERGRERESV